MVNIEEHKEYDSDGFTINYIVYDGNRYIGWLEVKNIIQLHFITECNIDNQIRILQGLKALLQTDKWKKLGE